MEISHGINHPEQSTMRPGGYFKPWPKARRAGAKVARFSGVPQRAPTPPPALPYLPSGYQKDVLPTEDTMCQSTPHTYETLKTSEADPKTMLTAKKSPPRTPSCAPNIYPSWTQTPPGSPAAKSGIGNGHGKGTPPPPRGCLGTPLRCRRMTVNGRAGDGRRAGCRWNRVWSRGRDHPGRRLAGSSVYSSHGALLSVKQREDGGSCCTVAVGRIWERYPDRGVRVQ